jgi:hypothetical protein
MKKILMLVLLVLSSYMVMARPENITYLVNYSSPYSPGQGIRTIGLTLPNDCTLLNFSCDNITCHARTNCTTPTPIGANWTYEAIIPMTHNQSPPHNQTLPTPEPKENSKIYMLLFLGVIIVILIAIILWKLPKAEDINGKTD